MSKKSLPFAALEDEPGLEDEGFICPICQRVFSSRAKLIRHEWTHEPERGGARDDGQRWTEDGQRIGEADKRMGETAER